MNRHVAIFALVQFLLVIVGFVILGVVMKFSGYPNTADPTVHWKPLAVGLRHHGAWFLLAPVVWVICTLVAENSQRRAWFAEIGSVLSLLLVAIAFFLFLCAAGSPYSRGFLYGVGSGSAGSLH